MSIIEFANLASITGPGGDSICPAPFKYLIGAGDVGVIYGPKSVGKTSLALDLAAAVAAHSPTWFGLRVRGGPVMFLDFGIRRGRRYGAVAAARHHKAPRGSLLWSLMADTLSADATGDRVARAIMDEALRRRDSKKPLRLIVINSMASACSDSERDAEAARHFFARLQDVAFSTNVAVIVTASEHAAAYGDLRLEVRRGHEDSRDVFVRHSEEGCAGYLLGSFELDAIPLGVDKDGDPITAPIVRGSAARHPYDLDYLKAVAEDDKP